MDIYFIGNIASLFSRLYKLVLKYLNLPTTNTSSERIFSKAEYTRQEHSRLTGKSKDIKYFSKYFILSFDLSLIDVYVRMYNVNDNFL